MQCNLAQAHFHVQCGRIKTSMAAEPKCFIGAIDQGTTSSRFLVSDRCLKIHFFIHVYRSLTNAALNVRTARRKSSNSQVLSEWPTSFRIYLICSLVVLRLIQRSWCGLWRSVSKKYGRRIRKWGQAEWSVSALLTSERPLYCGTRQPDNVSIMLLVGVASPLVSNIRFIFFSVWCDNRTEQLANELIQQTPSNSKDYYRVGLMASTTSQLSILSFSLARDRSTYPSVF